MSVSETSLRAYLEEQPKLNRREQEIYDFMQGREPLTDREIMQRMGFPEMNCVRPRITGLIDKRCLEEIDRVKCAVTNKTVRRVQVKSRNVERDGQSTFIF